MEWICLNATDLVDKIETNDQCHALTFGIQHIVFVHHWENVYDLHHVWAQNIQGKLISIASCLKE